MFKAGELVRVARKVESETKEKWMPEMDGSVGRIFKVLNVYDDGVELQDLPDADYGYVYPPAALEKCEAVFEHPAEWRGNKLVIDIEANPLMDFSALEARCKEGFKTTDLVIFSAPKGPNTGRYVKDIIFPEYKGARSSAGKAHITVAKMREHTGETDSYKLFH